MHLADLRVNMTAGQFFANSAFQTASVPGTREILQLMEQSCKILLSPAHIKDFQSFEIENYTRLSIFILPILQIILPYVRQSLVLTLESVFPKRSKVTCSGEQEKSSLEY